MAARAVQAAGFEYCAMTLQHYIDVTFPHGNNKIKNLLMQGVENAKKNHQKGINSFFEEYRQTHIATAQQILKTVARLTKDSKLPEFISVEDAAILNPPHQKWYSRLAFFWSAPPTESYARAHSL